jgi:hypothetical protein
LRSYLVQATTNVDGTRLNYVINDVREGCEEVGGVDFRVKEDLWGEKALVAYINGVFLAT